MSNIQKINSSEPNHIDAQLIEHSSKKRSGNKKSYNSIKIGILIGLIILSVGFGSYYVCSSLIAASNTQKPNNNSNSDVTTTPIDKNQSKNSKVDDSTNNVTSKVNSSDDYIFPKSGDKKLLDSDLSSLSKEKLALVRNEIFARHGHVFETEPYKSYFNGKPWYKANSDFKGKDEELNNIERYNLQLILKYEKR